MSRQAAIFSAAFLALALSGCADKPEVDQVAQQDMIGLSKRDMLACLGEPSRRERPADATEIWSYPLGVTTTGAPPWAAGLDFGLARPSLACEARVVLTNAHVTQVAYALADGRPLPSGRQCVFPVQPCARVRQAM